MIPHRSPPHGNQEQIQESTDQDETSEPSGNQERTTKAFADQSMTEVSSDESDGFDYQALMRGVAKRYCNAAYYEVAKLARNEGCWISWNTAWRFLRNPIKEFRVPAPAGRKAEVSTARAIVPIPVSQMASMMMDVDQWATSFFHIVYMGDGKDSNYILERLKEDDDTIQAVVEVHAIYQLPTCHVPTREFRFLRYKKKLPQNGYAIIDVSSNYIDSNTRTNSLRKPSGVIIRKQEEEEDNCEVVWIENVEVDELSENIYSSIINTNLAFCAQRWINMLLWNLKRESCTLLDEHVLVVHESARSYLLALTHSMKDFFKECLADKQKERLLTDISHNEKLKIFVNKTIEDIFAYIGTTSFHVKAKPRSVFQFLLEKNIELQLLELPNSEEPKLCLNVVTEDNSNSITLHRTRIGEQENYCLQEASRDEYCSFIISKPMSAEEVRLHIVSGVESDYEAGRTVNVQASGFAIMPDGPGALNPVVLL